MKEKTKVQRSLAVLIVAVIVVALIGIVMPLSASAADLTDSQTELGEAYCEFFNSMATGSVLESLTIAVTDIPLSWFDVISDIGDVLWVGDDIYYYLVGDDLYISRGGAGGRVCYSRSGGGGASRDDVHVTGDVLSNLAEMYQDHYGPKTTKEYISWRTDIRWSEHENFDLRLSFFKEGYFCGETDWREVYLVPFYFDGTTYYYSPIQYHFYKVYDENRSCFALVFDYWDMMDTGEIIGTATVCSDLTSVRYIDIAQMVGINQVYFSWYPSYELYLTREYTNANLYYPHVSNLTHSQIKFYSSDGDEIIECANEASYVTQFRQSVATHDSNCTISNACDMGYYCSDKPIHMNFDFIDTSKLTENDVVTLSGDTFYDYTITNSTTGDSTTVYNYITNNYTYPETDNGDSDDSGEEGSGSSSGNVLVSGAIDVGGQVDVNVNIEQSSSGSSSDFLVPVDDYAQYLPEVAPEVTEYLETTYSFLPPEIIGLLIGGIGAAVLCRILGR